MTTVADTAFCVATVRAEERLRPERERLFDDPYAALFAAGGEHAREATERVLALPFLRDAIRLRTRYIDDAVREGVAYGARQVVLLGAGFDARGLRLPEIAARGARVYEVDLAEQLERKRAVLRENGVALPEHVAHVPCDFTAPAFEEALDRDLAAHGFGCGALTVFVWEGVHPYLAVDATDRSLRWMARTGAAGSRLALQFIDAYFAPRTAASHVLGAGFSRFDDVGHDDLWRRWQQGEPHEHSAVLRMGTALV